ncbi:hypothetical protein [Streptomyces sp. NBC_00145]
MEADGPRRHTLYRCLYFDRSTTSCEPFSHPGNATIDMGGEGHGHAH